MFSFSDALILTGPTASGKSALALELAERIGGEIVAMDSMTLYRGLDIGTAKPTAEERARVPHYLIDVLEPWESANVAWWLERTNEACGEIRKRGKRPLFVGGTPFYLKALLHGLFESPPSDEGLRKRLEAEANEKGNEALHTKLVAVDPKLGAKLHANDVRRVVRALEVFHLTGKPLSEHQQTWDAPPVDIPCFVLEWPRELLYERINQRVEAMFAAGWLNEVRTLMSKPMGREASQALGYSELIEHLRKGKPSLSETVAIIQQRTRQFAKRQLTWFRGLKSCRMTPGTTSVQDLILLLDSNR
ncbi:MAG: tRNA (adenosine(37)-N6)-dimethylallyltransferase MiaA [Gemmataceae bacterium]|nr:tRNA (adenosine(37)-N6)-dimethylallyltransferase MiaA [Gemmataceae bacterium]